MHWETYIKLTFDSKGDLHCMADKVHIGISMPMPMPMPSFPNGLFYVLFACGLWFIQSICVLTHYNTIKVYHDLIILLYYEHWTDKQKYFYVYPYYSFRNLVFPLSMFPIFAVCSEFWDWCHL